MDFLNKWLKLNNMDGLVPTLELEDLYQEDGPLLKDHFLGVAPPSGEQPLCVVFVDPNAPNLHGDSGIINQQPTTGFYDEYTAPSWLENNVDLNDLDSLPNSQNFSQSPSSVSTQPFVEPHFIPDPYENFSSKVPYAAAPLEVKMAAPATTVPAQIQPQMKASPVVEQASEMELEDYYYDASPESMAPSVTSWASASTEEEYPSKEAILEEIHREAAVIERFSVSPPAHRSYKKASSRTTIRKASKPPKSRSANAPKSYVERKKELNRQAATKYREKKRAEREMLHTERESLETRNTELKAEVSALGSEIEYLKKLIKDIEARTK